MVTTTNPDGQITLDVLGRMADFRHLTAKDEDRVAFSGVHVKIRPDLTVDIEATNGYALAKTFLSIPAVPADPIDVILNGKDLAAAFTAFNVRAEQVDSEEVVSIDFDVVTDGIEFRLGPPDQIPLFDDEPQELATYVVRRHTEAEYPSFQKLFDGLPARRSAEPVHLSPVLLADLLKTYPGARVKPAEKPPITMSHYGLRKPVLVTTDLSVIPEPWRGLVMPITTGVEGVEL